MTNNIHHHINAGREFLFMELPENSHTYILLCGNILSWQGTHLDGDCKHLQGEYTFIGFWSELKHSDIVPLLLCEGDVYYNYEWQHYGFVYPLGSFISLLTSLNLTPDRVVVLEKMK